MISPRLLLLGNISILPYNILLALKVNMQFIFTSTKFSKFISFINSKDSKIACFFQSKLSKEIWNVKTKYYINKSMWQELNLLEWILASLDKFT